MKNRKINLDRPQLSSKEIQAHKNFDQVLSNYNVMSKPFYKSNWFIGTTGLASIGLIIGGTFAFQNPEQMDNKSQVLNTDSPPDLVVPDNNLISMTNDNNDLSKDLVKETIYHINSTNTGDLHEETFTLETDNNNLENTNDLTGEEGLELIDKDDENITLVDEKKGFNILDLSPRISGKLDGSITKEELFDNKGITTESDVSVIHFELHLIDLLE